MSGEAGRTATRHYYVAVHLQALTDDIVALHEKACHLRAEADEIDTLAASMLRKLASRGTAVIRSLDTPEAREFWASAERNAGVVESWPDWKRAGINVDPVPTDDGERR